MKELQTLLCVNTRKAHKVRTDGVPEALEAFPIADERPHVDRQLRPSTDDGQYSGNAKQRVTDVEAKICPRDCHPRLQGGGGG